MVKGIEALEREGAFLEITQQVTGRLHSTQAALTPKAPLEPQPPKGVPAVCLLPPPTIPGFLESDS